MLLAEHLLGRACADYGLARKTLTPEALATLRAHDWPGNIRELGNVIERVALLSESGAVTGDVLGLSRPTAESRRASAPSGTDVVHRRLDDAGAASERDDLVAALAAVGGNVTRAAKTLGLTRNTLRYRLRKHGVRRASTEAAPVPAAGANVLTSPARWERRPVTALRVVFTTAAEKLEHAQRAMLEEVMEKIAVFGGARDAIGPAGVTAVFGV